MNWKRQNQMKPTYKCTVSLCLHPIGASSEKAQQLRGEWKHIHLFLFFFLNEREQSQGSKLILHRFVFEKKKKKSWVSKEITQAISIHVVMKIAAAKIYFKELLISLFTRIPSEVVSNTTYFLFSLQSFPSVSKLLIAD